MLITRICQLFDPLDCQPGSRVEFPKQEYEVVGTSLRDPPTKRIKPMCPVPLALTILHH